MPQPGQKDVTTLDTQRVVEKIDQYYISPQKYAAVLSEILNDIDMQDRNKNGAIHPANGMVRRDALPPAMRAELERHFGALPELMVLNQREISQVAANIIKILDSDGDGIAMRDEALRASEDPQRKAAAEAQLKRLLLDANGNYLVPREALDTVVPSAAYSAVLGSIMDRLDHYGDGLRDGKVRTADIPATERALLEEKFGALPPELNLHHEALGAVAREVLATLDTNGDGMTGVREAAAAPKGEAENRLGALIGRAPMVPRAKPSVPAASTVRRPGAKPPVPNAQMADAGRAETAPTTSSSSATPPERLNGVVSGRKFEQNMFANLDELDGMDGSRDNMVSLARLAPQVREKLETVMGAKLPDFLIVNSQAVPQVAKDILGKLGAAPGKDLTLDEALSKLPAAEAGKELARLFVDMNNNPIASGGGTVPDARSRGGSGRATS